MWKHLKVLLSLCLLVFCGVAYASAQATYYVTETQLNSLKELITNLQNNNESMTSLLNLQMSEYENLQKTYEEKSATTDKQLQNYQQLLSKSASRELIYKYGIAGAFVVGLIVGIFVAK